RGSIFRLTSLGMVWGKGFSRHVASDVAEFLAADVGAGDIHLSCAAVCGPGVFSDRRVETRRYTGALAVLCAVPATDGAGPAGAVAHDRRRFAGIGHADGQNH